MRISEHISYKEATESFTAKRFNIPNIPGDYEIINMQILADRVFEPLRRFADGPIKVNSFYRSKELNKYIGGSSTSQHVQGRAIDIDDVYGAMSNADMFDYIRLNLDFDQLIWELGDNDNPAWVHVSYVSPEENRRSVLRAWASPNGVYYTTY